MKKLIILLLALVVFACSQNTVKEENTANEQAHQTQTNTTTAVQKSENPHPQMEKKIIVPDEVMKKYKSVILQIKDKKENKDIETEIIIGQTSEVSGTPLSITVEAFLPDFIMDDKGLMTSKSAEENNPAVKVKIYKDKQLVFDGWVFGKFPDMHAFNDDRYSVYYKSAVKK